MCLKMNSKALFIGFRDCDYCIKAEKFLRICGLEVETWWTPRRRRTKLPDDIGSWSGDYIFHMKSYCILPQSLLSRAKVASINFHPSSPKYPGSGGISWALYNNDNKTGVTVHLMNEKIDNGKIIKVYDVPIYPKDCVSSVLERVHLKQLDAFYDIIMHIVNEGANGLWKASENQSHSWAKKVGKIREIDNLETIDVDISPEELDRVIRATHFKDYGPKIYIHGHKFKFTGVEK